MSSSNLPEPSPNAQAQLHQLEHCLSHVWSTIMHLGVKPLRQERASTMHLVRWLLFLSYVLLGCAGYPRQGLELLRFQARITDTGELAKPTKKNQRKKGSK